VAVLAVAVAIGIAWRSFSARHEVAGLSLEEFPQAATQEPPDPAFKHRVVIESEPAGATVVCYPLDFFTGRPIFAERVEAATRTPTEVELVNGTYLVVAYTDEAFHEVLRFVPRQAHASLGAFRHESSEWDAKSKTLRWQPIRLFPRVLPNEVLVAIAGAEEFEVDTTSAGGRKEAFKVPSFMIEPREVSVEKYVRLPTFRYSRRPKNLPANDLSWGQAVAYAESRGLRLPDLLEIEWLATVQGKHPFPWGDGDPPANNWNADRAVDGPTHDQLTTNVTITGLHSGALEWLGTRTSVGYGTDGPGLRYLIRGGSTRLIDQPALVDDAGLWVSVNEYVRNPAIGVRCARSPQPRRKAEDFIGSVPQVKQSPSD
jgi:hypothetical protein